MTTAAVAAPRRRMCRQVAELRCAGFGEYEPRRLHLLSGITARWRRVCLFEARPQRDHRQGCGPESRSRSSITTRIGTSRTAWRFTYTPSPAALGGGAHQRRVSIPSGVTIRWARGDRTPRKGRIVVSTVDAQGQTQLGPFTGRGRSQPSGRRASISITPRERAVCRVFPGMASRMRRPAVEPSTRPCPASPTTCCRRSTGTCRRPIRCFRLSSQYDAELQSQQVVGFTGDNFPGPGAGAANAHRPVARSRQQNSDLGPGDGFMSNSLVLVGRRVRVHLQRPPANQSTTGRTRLRR